jgi:hypothetical protein
LVWDCKPVLVGKIEEDAKQWGMSSKTLRRAATDLQIIRNPPGGGPKVTWALPDAFVKRLKESNGESTGIDEAIDQAKALEKKQVQPQQIGGVDISDLDGGLAQLLGGEEGGDEDEGDDESV